MNGARRGRWANAASMRRIIAAGRLEAKGATLLAIALLFAASFLWLFPAVGVAAFQAAPVSPVAPSSQPMLLELFTSEGCSSCPPADALLAQIARERHDVVVLSEHVTYWNGLGWKDPFSLAESTTRQAEYARRLGLDSSYTPQMVVDGRKQFVGSDRSALRSALSGGGTKTNVPLTITMLPGAPGSFAFAAKLGQTDAPGRLIAVLVQREGHQEVSRGENGGRLLSHVSIARGFRTLGEVRAGQSFDGPGQFLLPAGGRRADYRVVVFFQQGAGGPILATASALSELS